MTIVSMTLLIRVHEALIPFFSFRHQEQYVDKDVWTCFNISRFYTILFVHYYKFLLQETQTALCMLTKTC